ncbi:hypothetical protein GQX73_g10284 [Xylaria multiplex]|uniref:3-phytase n=1 Tax=Xylaria multiplex TaxID=323545 RepID=A0A7C8MFK0_9PEZI|nr:hypothetical protein GQX73_g10284 [Xylaria multiplex]
MLPVLQGVVDLLRSGPETPVVQGAADGDEGNSVDVVGPLTVAFTHDNQINELASILGVFDEQVPLAADSLDESRIYVSSRINPMRGTVAFERLDCSGRKYLRLLLNDAVYPVPSCKSGPGVSCPLREYDERVLARKWAEAGGSFETLCQLPQGSASTSSRTGGVTFFTDLTLKGIRVVRP